MRAWSLGILGWLLLRILALTWRIRVEEPPELTGSLNNQKTVVLAHWHRDELALLSVCRRYRICSLVSTSQDGQMMTVILRLFGVGIARGSSTRGGVSGYLSLIKLIKKSKRNGSFAVDGPKGPVFKVKPGVLKLAEHLKAPIFYSGVAVSKAWRFPKSWNQAYLPKPFAKILIQWHLYNPNLDMNGIVSDGQAQSRAYEFSEIDAVDKNVDKTALKAAELSNLMIKAHSQAENDLSKS